MKTGAELISEERKRQIEVEGYDKYHDSDHDGNELVYAAMCYATPEERKCFMNGTPILWPWEPQFWKPTPNDRVRELVKAGALIAAEIDRLQNANENK